MLVVSAAHGMAVRCNPANGKVDRHALFSTDDGVPLRVNVVRIEGQRILWGFTQGFITMSIRTKPLVVRQLRVFADFHQGPVSALALPAFLQDTVLSAGDDGAVKLWDVARSSCVETLIGTLCIPTCLEVLRDNRVVAGYSNGVIVVWNIHVGQIMKRHRDRQPREEMDSAAQRLVISPTVPETSTPVTRILHDGNSNSILASHEGSQEVRRYDLTSGTCIAVFGDGHPLGNITCMEWDTAQPVDSLSLDIALKLRGPKTNAKEAAILASYKSDNGFKSTRLLVTGDASGLICLWDGDAVPAQEGGVIKPLRVLDEHTGSISALFIDAAKVISGSDDGWIRVWDPLTGYLVNVMGNKIPRHAPIDRNDISLTRVSRICCDDYRGVANVGHEIKTWDFSPEKQLLARRNLKPKGRSTVAEARHHHYELKQDIRESKDALKEEKIERENMAKKVHTQSLGGLSDEEMLAYAMMLSQEENAQKQQPFIQREDYIEGDDDEVMQAIIASLEDQTMDESPGGGSGSSSGSGTNSALHTQSTSPEPSSSGGDGDIGYEDSYHEELERWPPVNDSDKDRDARQWQRPGFVDEDDDENDEELQYVLKLSRGEI
ncbi:WD40-repeat-containing domain protein [Syncephalastrum racemosum]|uniref:WD40-repeat-containing domain protein n=1 Tax=Syncephalastrum racemosum TaxID=13706 RepID=A0A1X2HVJ9_SYNRA|nr:WD40-repeat-containing domain protein [Syncephalastrum racemosum]